MQETRATRTQIHFCSMNLGKLPASRCMVALPVNLLLILLSDFQCSIYYNRTLADLGTGT